MTSSTSNKPLTLIELSDLVGGTVEGDGRTLITGAAPIESAQPGDISFVANPKYGQYIETTAASALVLDPETACTHKPVIRHKNPYLIFAKILDRLYADPILVEPGISPQAIIEPGAQIGANCSIGPLCHIRASARIGDNCSSFRPSMSATIARSRIIALFIPESVSFMAPGLAVARSYMPEPCSARMVSASRLRRKG